MNATQEIRDLLDFYYLEEEERYDDDVFQEIAQIAYESLNTDRETDEEFYNIINNALSDWKQNNQTPTDAAERILHNVKEW